MTCHHWQLHINATTMQELSAAEAGRSDPHVKSIHHHHPTLVSLQLKSIGKTIYSLSKPHTLSRSLSLSLFIASHCIVLCFFHPHKKVMAACGSLRSLFENPLPEKPKSFIESLKWNQGKPKKPIDPSSFTELFGELHFREKPDASSDGCPRLDLSELLDEKKRRSGDIPSSDPLLGAPPKERPKSNGGFSPKSPESLQLCTEGLGSESSDDVEEDVVVGGGGDDWRSNHENNKEDGNGYLISSYSDVRGRRGRGFPPPISSIGRGGKPWVCFKSFREGGRFVLREIRIPTHEFLHASREDGRLKLHFVCPDMDIQEGEEEGQDEEEEDEEEVGMEATVQEQIQSH